MPMHDDIQLLKELKVNHYLFSISWPRILPTGIRPQVNEKGIQFYNNIINALLENRIVPIVTLYYWDLPQAIVEEGYETGQHAPGLRLGSDGAYKAAHHIIKAHAEVWHSYDKKWRQEQRGTAGTSLTSTWGEPIDLSNNKDIEAAERHLQFSLGWFASPIYHRDYPQIMKDYTGRKSAKQGLASRLPVFSAQEKSYIKGTADFLGISHFTTRYISQKNYPPEELSYFTDKDLMELVDPKGSNAGSRWVYTVPWGFRRLLNFVKAQYGNPLIYVTENGISEKLLYAQLCDEWRINYLKGYINEMLKATKDGVNIQGYTAWSLLDKFEWEQGYSERFGLCYVDFQYQNKPWYPKASVYYYKAIVGANGFPNPREEEQRNSAANILKLIHEPLTTHLKMVTEIVVPTVFTLCILVSAVLLMILLRKHH